MGNGIINENYLNDIAIAIQSKTGSSSTMTPSEMAGQIDSIHTAGDVVLGSGSFSANGTYSAASDNLDGYDTVTVTIPLSSITISANGSYSAAQGGYNNISVEVPQVSLSTLNVSINDTYTAPSGTAYDEVVVNVPGAVLSSKTISANGTYNAIDDNLDGYSSIVVNVSGDSTKYYEEFDTSDPDVIDVLVATCDQVSLSDSTATTDFYETYKDKRINTLKVIAGENTTQLRGLNYGPTKLLFNKLIVDSTITHVDDKIADISCLKEAVFNCSLNLYQIGAIFSGNVYIKKLDLSNCTFTSSTAYPLNSFISGCCGLEEVILPDNLTTLGNYFADGCYNLNKINTNNITTLQGVCFRNTYNLQRVNLDNIINLGGSAFDSSGIQEAYLPNVTTMGSSCFYNCYNLYKVVLNSNITSIPESAFYNCKRLKNFDFTNITTIGKQAFRNTGLENIIFTNNTTLGEYSLSGTEIQSIDLNNCNIDNANYLLYDCKKLKNVILPSDLTAICNKTFASTGLEVVNFIPNTVTTLKGNAFEYCKSLINVDLNNITTLGSACFQYCTSLTSIDLKNVTSIGEDCFYHCELLKNVNLRNVISIGRYAFSSTIIEELEVPSTVTSIGNYAFSTSTLKTLTFYDSGLTLTDSAFGSYITTINYRGSEGKTVADLEVEYASKYGSTSNFKPTSTRTVNYIPYEDWNT